MRNTTAILALSVVIAQPVPAGAQPDPSDGTVFIRLVGSLQVLSGGDERLRKELLLDLQQVEVGTGSGFVVSPLGWVVTNHHVVSGVRINAVIDNVKVQIAVDVQRIEVVLPAGAGSNGEPRRFSASVYASDADLDLAVLSIVAPEVPFVGLGDSDAVVSGDAVRVVGYPFGSEVEIGKSAASARIPDVGVSSGSISALRRNDLGEVRYLQTSAPLNPGNSGGPILDADGAVVGVAQSVLKDARGVGFAIPINLVKAFLRQHGIDRNLPSPILTLGPFLDASDKGIRLRVPEGYQDGGRSRLRVEATGGDTGPVLHIDRLATPFSVEQVEAALLGGGSLERYQASGSARRWSRGDRTTRAIGGWSKGHNPATGDETAVIYTILDLGREKVVARYVGTAQAIAMNRSVLQASLADLDARPLLIGEISRTVAAAFTAGSPQPAGFPATPSGWILEPGMPSPCGGLPAPEAALAISPPGDFTVQFRAAWWSRGPADPLLPARACGGQPAAAGDASYLSQAEWWGDTYQAHGVFVTAASQGIWQLEGVAPVRKAGYVAALFKEWVATIGR